MLLPKHKHQHSTLLALPRGIVLAGLAPPKQWHNIGGHLPPATSRKPTLESYDFHPAYLNSSLRMISPRLFIAMTIVVSASCRGSIRALPVLSQQRKPWSTSSSPSILLGFVPHRRQVHLPSRKLFERPAATSSLDDASDERSKNQRISSISSVSGPIYELKGVPTVKLFTKQGCTLCDKVKDVSSTFLSKSNWLCTLPSCRHFLSNMLSLPFLVGTRISTRSSATLIDTSRYYR
jgi:hypothetical protein